MTADIAAPRDSEGNMSAIMTGLRTLVATAQPVRNREKIRSLMFWLSAVMTIPTMKQQLATL